jgi:hypothetical protein
MRIRRFVIATANILSLCLLSTSALAFESTEHMVIGNNVKLQFPEGQSFNSLRLPNGLDLSYGEILALGGDYFAIIDLPISKGIGIEDQKLRFRQTFETLANSPNAPNQALLLITSFKKILEEIIEGQKKGKSGSEVYAEVGASTIGEYNVITGGGSSITPLFPYGHSISELLSNVNWDHFAPNALLAYQAGHIVAIEEAIKAGKVKNEKKTSDGLERAYAMNAFACHYLSDTFSSGHMRTPREALSNAVESSLIATLLMGYMHGEDSTNGLKVSNLNGDQWMAFGDSYYFDSKNEANRLRLEKIMQISADEIYFAYQHGINPSEGKISEEINNLLPQFALLQDEDKHLNTSPLFFWDKNEQVLKRRTDINALYNYEWTSSWWGWSTLVDLEEYHDPLPAMKAALHEVLSYMRD